MKKLLLLLVFAGMGWAQAPEPLPADVDAAIAGMVNFEGTVSLGVTNLVTNVAPSIMPIGWILLGIFGVYALLQSLAHSALQSVSSHYYHPLAMVVAYVAILYRVVIASLMLSFYMVPFPGVSFNFHNMFPTLATALANTVTTDLLRQVLGHFADAVHYLPPVGMFQVLPALLTVVVLSLIALGQVGMTIMTAGSYAIVGVLTLCGPLAIPFYVLPKWDRKFWTWFENMLSYSMYIFVGSAFIYVFCHSYLDFFTNLHGFSVGQWLVSAVYLALITVVFLFCMFKVPEITHIVFGGMGGVAQGFANALQGLVVRGVAAAFL